MEEKIKVYVPQSVYNILTKDMELFEFFKKDGSLNKNAFINRLIMSYQKDYSEKQKKIREIITESITEFNGSSYKTDEAGYMILNRLNLYSNGSDENSEVHISFRPNKESANTIDFIENHELKGSSRSNYYRSLFDSYCMLPQDKRERIIFRNLVEKIEQAIEEDRQIYLLSKQNHDLNKPGVILSPYSLSLTKEELFNYLLGELSEYQAVRTTRLCRIQSIRILNERRVFTDPVLNILDKMIFNGPQYKYDENEKDPIIVQFTDEGIRKFRYYFVHRPIPVSIEDHTYTFSCSYSQAANYFSRFGSDAVVISPVELREQMREFYEKAVKEYL